jgi:pantothenate kinase
VTDVTELAARARGLLAHRDRAILGITGAPGAGKTTLVELLLAALKKAPPEGMDGEAWVAHVPMDGFHLADVQLDRLGLRHRKGAPETFDAAGYHATLRRILDDDPAEVVYVPGFERVLEQPLAAAIAVLPEARLILTEGNYLLLDDGAWPQVRSAMTEVWYVDLPDDVRRRRLIDRHVTFGKTPESAREWVDRVDEGNAAVVCAARSAADLVVEL